MVAAVGGWRRWEAGAGAPCLAGGPVILAVAFWEEKEKRNFDTFCNIFASRRSLASV